jgi:hypothetical protein
LSDKQNLRMQAYPIYHYQQQLQQYPMWQGQAAQFSQQPSGLGLQQQKEQHEPNMAPMNPYIGGSAQYLQPYSYGLYQQRPLPRLRQGGQYEVDDLDGDVAVRIPYTSIKNNTDFDDDESRHGGDDSDSSSDDDDDDDRNGGLENESRHGGDDSDSSSDDDDDDDRNGGLEKEQDELDTAESSSLRAGGGGEIPTKRIGGGKVKRKMSLKYAMEFVKSQRPKYAKKWTRLITLGNYQNRTKFAKRIGTMRDVYKGVAHHTKSGQMRQDLLVIRKEKTSRGQTKPMIRQRIVSIRKWVVGVKQYAKNKDAMIPWQYKKEPGKAKAPAKAKAKAPASKKAKNKAKPVMSANAKHPILESMARDLADFDKRSMAANERATEKAIRSIKSVATLKKMLKDGPTSIITPRIMLILAAAIAVAEGKKKK